MHSITATDTSVQQAPCTTCGHSSEEDRASDTSASETTTTTAVPAAAGLHRLVVPEAPAGADSTQPGGSCHTGAQCSSSRASSVQSVDTVALGSLAAAAVSAAGTVPHPAQLQQQPAGIVSAAAPSKQHAPAADITPAVAGIGHLLSPQAPAGQQCASAQHQASHQQQQQEELCPQSQPPQLQPPKLQSPQQQNKESTDLKVLLARHAALKQYALAGFTAALQQGAVQQAAVQQARLPPLPTPRQQQQQRSTLQPHPQQQQQPGVPHTSCLACSVSPFGRCECCQLQQQVLAAGCLPTPAGHAAHQLQQQLLLLQQHQQQQLHQQQQQLQQQQLHHQQQQQQAAAARQQQLQSGPQPLPTAKARKQQQQPRAQQQQQQQSRAQQKQKQQARDQQQQQMQALQQQQQTQALQQQHQQQQLLLLQQQQQQQLQQVYSVPLANRPWGWWRSAGRCNLLQQLDIVRQPLLRLHTRIGDISSSDALLRAVGVAQPQQQQQQLVSAASCSAGVGACWQYLLSQQSHLQQQQPRASSQGGAAGDSSIAAAAAAAGAAAAAAELQAAEAAAAAAKPPKRPWQPKMAPDEPTWNQAAFADIQARYSQAAAAAATDADANAAAADAPQPGKGAQKWPRTQPEHSTATFAQLMLLHGAGWPNHLMWEHWQAAHPAGSLALFVHMKQGVSLSPGMPGRELIAKTKLKASLDSRWGDISLVEATLASMEEILKRCPHVQHIGLASGHDVPVQLIKPGLLLPGVSLFGLYQFGAPEMQTLKDAVVDELLENSSMDREEADTWGNALSFHHQWMVLSREHAAALVHHRREIILVGRLLHRACCSVRAGMAPDEFIILTALKHRGFVRSVQRVEVKPHMRYPPGCFLNSYPTFVVFPAESSPHPVLWTHLQRRVRCQVEKNTGQQYYTHLSLNDCLDLAVERCAIFFRKIEIRQTQAEDMVLLLSSLEAMWAGQRKGSTAALKSGGSSSTGGSRRKGKRKQSPTPPNSTTPQMSQDTGSSPASSAAAAAVCQDLVGMSAGPDFKRLRESVQAAC